MSGLVVQLALRNGTPEQLEEALDADERWQRAAQEGLRERVVAVHASDPQQVTISAFWDNQESALRFREELGRDIVSPAAGHAVEVDVPEPPKLVVSPGFTQQSY